MRPSRNVLTYAGVAVAAVGFALIGYTWARVAGLTAVPLQLPYLVSGGLTAIGLLVVGATLVNLDAKLRDAAQRDRQLQQLADLLDQIRVLLGGEERPPEPAAEEAEADEREWETSDDTAEIAPVRLGRSLGKLVGR